jgi:hypothetical protein
MDADGLIAIWLSYRNALTKLAGMDEIAPSAMDAAERDGSPRDGWGDLQPYFDAVPTYTIDLGPPGPVDPLIIGPGGVLDDWSDALAYVLSDLRRESARKIRPFFEAVVNFEANPQSPEPTFLSGDEVDERRRFERFLKRRGAIFTDSKGDDGSQDVLIDIGSKGILRFALARLRRFVERLRRQRLYPYPNPFAVDGWDKAISQRILEAGNLFVQRQQDDGIRNRFRRTYRGNQYRIVDVEASKPRMEDPTGSVGRALAAAVRDRWPTTPLLILRVTIDSGARTGDVILRTAGDWARGSRFGRVIQVANKGKKSKDGRPDPAVKDAVLAEETAFLLAQSFDDRHALDDQVPDMAGLRALLAARDLHRLDQIPLFPNARGQAMSYSGYNDVYLRPTMRGRDARNPRRLRDHDPILIDYDPSTVHQAGRPSDDGYKSGSYFTGHCARHAKIDGRLRRKIYLPGRTNEAITADLRRLARHMHCSVENIRYYSASCERDWDIMQQLHDLDEDKECHHRTDGPRRTVRSQHMFLLGGA